MKKFLVLVILVAIGYGMYVTNPQEEDHRNKLGEVWGDALRENVLGMKGKIFGGKIGDKLIGTTVAGLAEYHNYYLVSTMKLQGTTISVGAFNYVYCGTSEQVSETIVEKIQDALQGNKK